MNFKKTKDVTAFFNILPEEWKESILPFWEDLKSTTNCFVIEDDNEIIAGGLVFSTCTPDMQYAVTEADFWFQKGYLYLGYIFVIPEKRGENLGSFWLENLKKLHPTQKYWLTIEDANLHHFYTKNGFNRVKTLFNNGTEEIVYVLDNV